MARYRVRVELIEVVSDQSGITENIIDASDGQLRSSLTEAQELFYNAMKEAKPIALA
jgi:hypothetical protein